MNRKIIFVTESSGFGGSETYLLDLAVASRTVAEVSIVLPFREENSRLREELKKREIPVLELKQYRGIYPWNLLIALIFFLRHREALFHFTLPHPDSCRWTLLAASLLRRRFLISELLVPPNPFRVSWYFTITHLLFNGFKRLSYYRAFKVVAICQEMKKTLVRAYGMPTEKISVIYNGIEMTEAKIPSVEIDALRREFDLEEGAVLLTTAGRLTEQKGHRYLISAFERLTAEFPHAVLLILGEGPLLPSLKKDVADRGLDRRVRFAGFRKGFRNILRMTNIFIFPSLDEGFPYMVIEAMAACNPVVATTVGGIPEAVIEGNTGHLVPPRDDEQLYLAIRDLLNHPVQRRTMGENGRKRVKKLFTREIMLQKMFALYEHVL